MGRAACFSKIASEGVRENGFRLQKERFRFGSKKHFFTKQVKYKNSLIR